MKSFGIAGHAKAHQQAGAVVDEPAAAVDARPRPLLPRRLQLVPGGVPAHPPRQVPTILNWLSHSLIHVAPRRHCLYVVKL